jgi:NAD(P)-dependent dehydrogenase (short-subunit alcohol dehydrogenase family)
MTTVITGATRGLGLEAAIKLADDHSRSIVITARDAASGEKAAARISEASGNDKISVLIMDLASLDSVRTAAARLTAMDLPPINCLVASAGLSMGSADVRSADGYEMAFAVNHLGHFLLTSMLLPHMSEPGRIVIVASGVHDPKYSGGPMTPPHYEKPEWLAYPEHDPHLPAKAGEAGGYTYSNSKLCNMLFTYELERRLREAGRNITVNAYDPGFMPGTGLGRDSRGMVRFMWFRMLPLMSRLFKFGSSPERSGAFLAALAGSQEFEGISGWYFSVDEKTESSSDSHSRDFARGLWEYSAGLTGLQ